MQDSCTSPGIPATEYRLHKCQDLSRDMKGVFAGVDFLDTVLSRGVGLDG